MRIHRAALAVGVLVVVMAGCGGDGASPRAAASESAVNAAGSPPSITAQGVGKATGVPDVLSVTLAIHTEGDTATGTLQENSLRTQQMLDATKQAGVDPKDVQTLNVSVGPRFDYTNPNRPKVVGYAADNTFEVKLRDLSKAGATIDGLSTTAGDFLQVQGVGYSIDDSTDLLASARADAVKRASTQAKQLADAAGVSLGRVRTITEVPQVAYPNGAGAAADGALRADGSAVPVALAPGSQQLTLTVTVVYDIG